MKHKVRILVSAATLAALAALCALIHAATARERALHTCEGIRLEYTRCQLSDVYQHDMTAPYDPPVPVRHPVPLGIYVLKSGLFNDVDYRNGRVRDVVFRNIALTVDGGVPDPRPQLISLDQDHDIRGVLIENLTINGRRVTDPAALDMNPFATDVTLR